MPTRVEIGRRVREARTGAALTQDELAAALRDAPYNLAGCDRYRIGVWEKGRNAPSDKYAAALAAYFKTDADWFRADRSAEGLAEALDGLVVRFDDLERRVQALEPLAGRPARGEGRAAGEAPR